MNKSRQLCNKISLFVLQGCYLPWCTWGGWNAITTSTFTSAYLSVCASTFPLKFFPLFSWRLFNFLENLFFNMAFMSFLKIKKEIEIVWKVCRFSNVSPEGEKSFQGKKSKATSRNFQLIREVPKQAHVNPWSVKNDLQLHALLVIWEM